MEYNRSIDSFITFLIDPHVNKATPQIPNSIFWIKDDRFIAEMKDSKSFWIDYKIWDEISKQFDLDYDETQFVIKTWLEKNYELGGLTPGRVWVSNLWGWKNIMFVKAVL